MTDIIRPPKAPLSHSDPKEHARLIAQRANRALVQGEPILHSEFTVATLPDAVDWKTGGVYVSDEAGGATLAFSDGTNWRRVQDRAIVS